MYFCYIYMNVFISGPFPVCNLSLFLTCVQAWTSKYIYYTLYYNLSREN